MPRRIAARIPSLVLADRFAEPDERLEAAAGQAAEETLDQHLDVLEREAGLEDPTDGFLERVGAPHLAPGGLDPGERGGLLVGQLVGLFEQRPAGVLEALGGVLVADRAQLVPVAAADLVQRLVGQLHDVIRVDADDRLRGAGANRFRVARTHVIETARSSPARAKIADSISRPGSSHAPAMPSLAGTVGHAPNGTMIAGSLTSRGCAGAVSAGGGSSSSKNASAAAAPDPSHPHTTWRR